MIVFIHNIIPLQQKNTADLMWKKLQNEGEKAALVCSTLTLDERQKQLEKFCSGNMVLLTTDVLARGFDVKEVKLVINYDLPLSAHNTVNHKLFLFRISRAGRMRKGLAISLLNPNSNEPKHYKDLANYYGFSIRKL